MIIDIILGNNIDTKMWINDLKTNGAEYIIVIDYENHKEPKEIDGIIYMDPINAQKYIRKFDAKNYYKSVYGFPGMSGTMSSLHRENKN
ncbi:hypothetical protein [Planococcus sp. ISL-110]|uniref:hypothetical protein n=1 Tax=Planococcus sp. ISL-110 TaxID=2819167 RepID=UPI001BE9C713|nr:hypothetical protein [Planococcus sp. ISL-110]MBT2571129.1 hypothetical protein [Planococcus sp. ISL-110]